MIVANSNLRMVADMKIPVILDTDIGTDIDDTWALAMMLNSPELDIKLITSATLDTYERAKIIARILEIAGRTEIPIGIGIKNDDKPLPQSPWVADYDLSSYPGIVYDDASSAIEAVVTASDRPLTIIAIGPLTNIADALDRYPQIADNSRFIGMCGSVFRGYANDTPVAEYNVMLDVKAAQKVFTAPWEITFTPLDTCGIVRLEGDHYRRVADSASPLAKSVIDNYRVWLNGQPDEGRSSILYDTVAIYLAFCDDLLEMRELGIRVTDEGFTIPDASSKVTKFATAWRDIGGFYDLLVDRLMQ
ncbi:MAG: nucleoside hydrolase [Armatimonadota bacterium]